MCTADGLRPRSDATVGGGGGSFALTEQRDYDMLNHLCFFAAGTVGLCRASPFKLGSLPGRRPSSAPLYGSRELKGLEGPAASYQRQNRRFWCLFILISENSGAYFLLYYFCCMEPNREGFPSSSRC